MPKYIFLMLLSFLQGCFNKHGLKPLWQAPVASQETPIVQNGTVYVPGIRAGHPEEPRRLFALDALTGKEKWVSADSVWQVYGESGGSVFFQNMAKHLVQLNAATGEKIYESEDEGGAAILDWAIRDDVMFIVNVSLEVVAVDNRQSKVLWRMKLPFDWANNMALHLQDDQVIVNGHFKNGDEQFGMVWALDAKTGAENWYFQPPAPRDFEPLHILVAAPYVLATNTSPLALRTHVLDIRTGKELYAPIASFDFYGCRSDTAYAPNGAYDLKTGQRIGNGESWIAGNVVYNGIAWKRKMESVGAVESLTLRTTYDGDVRGNRDWTNTPPNCSIEGTDLKTRKVIKGTKTYKYTQFSEPVEAGGMLYFSSLAIMKEGTSGVWAYRLPEND